jgi:predicted Rossmann fold nucleotide-binding protein DprA/Smf involved in DNA uptake
LIRDGATPARSGKEIADNLRIVSYPQLLRPNSLFNVKLPLEVLSDEESRVYCLISDDPLGIDTLSEKSNFEIGTLLCILLNLELKGLINQISGQLFIRS